MKFTLEISMENAAFDEDGGANLELSYILSGLAGKLRNLTYDAKDGFFHVVFDTNGNRCGVAEVKWGEE